MCIFTGGDSRHIFRTAGASAYFQAQNLTHSKKTKYWKLTNMTGKNAARRCSEKGNTGTALNTSRRCFFQGEATFSIAGNRFNHLTLHLFRCCDYASWEGDCLRDSLIRKFQFYFAFIALRAARSHWSVISGAKLRFPWMPRLFRGA